MGLDYDIKLSPFGFSIDGTYSFCCDCVYTSFNIVGIVSLVSNIIDLRRKYKLYNSHIF